MSRCTPSKTYEKKKAKIINGADINLYKWLEELYVFFFYIERVDWNGTIFAHFAIIFIINNVIKC